MVMNSSANAAGAITVAMRAPKTVLMAAFLDNIFIISSQKICLQISLQASLQPAYLLAFLVHPFLFWFFYQK
jgi:hypothetical protein